MGVTYKLKDEIIEFIVRQKGENPPISCRKLVVIIEEIFHLHVSKSSINAVIKDAHLSSPVGRTPKEIDKSKKFSIPQKKKTQLFGSQSIEAEPSQKSKIVVEKTVALPKIFKSKDSYGDKPSLNKEIISNTELSQSNDIKENAISTLPTITKNDSNFGSEVRDTEILRDESVHLPVLDFHEDQGEERHFGIKDITPFLTRLVLWDFFPQLLLQEFFKRHTVFSEREMRIVDVLACFSSLDSDSSSAALDPENMWLWSLSGWDIIPQKEEVENVIKILNATKVSRFDYLLEIDYFCSKARFVKILLVNQKELVTDGRFMFLGSEPTNTLPSCPIERAIEETTRFVNGEGIFVMSCCSVQMMMDVVGDLISCCDPSYNNAIKKIIVIGLENNQLLEIAHAPQRSRNFILTAHMSLEHFESLFRIPLRFIPEQKIFRAGVEIMYVDASTKLSVVEGQENQVPIRIVAFYHAAVGLAEICLTNMSQTAISVKRLEAELPMFSQAFDIDEFVDNAPIQTESILDSNDSEVVLAEGIMYLKGAILKDMNMTLGKLTKSNDEHMSTCRLKGYAVSNGFNYKIGIKPEGESEVAIARAVLKVVSIYNKRSFNGKKLLFIL